MLLSKEKILNNFPEVKDYLTKFDKEDIRLELSKIDIGELNDSQISNLEQFVSSLTEEETVDFLLRHLDELKKSIDRSKGIEFLRKFKHILLAPQKKPNGN